MKKEKKEVKQGTKKIIDDIIPVRNESGQATHIDIVLSNGTSFSVPNTKSALLHYRSIMLEQAKEQKSLIDPTSKSFKGCRIMFFAGVAGAVLVNTTQFGQDIGQATGSIISGVVTLAGGIGMLVKNKNLASIQRNVTFACHKDEINKAISQNPYIYINVCDKDKKLIEEWLTINYREPIVIENIYRLEPQTIHRIWENINLYKHFEFEYKVGEVWEEPGFQKIIEKQEGKKELKEQSK